MTKENLQKGIELVREIDFIEGLLKGSLTANGWVTIKKRTPSQPELYPVSNDTISAMMNDNEAIVMVIADPWKKKLYDLLEKLNHDFRKL